MRYSSSLLLLNVDLRAHPPDPQIYSLIADYIPFIMLITSLYTAAGGLVVRGALSGQPGVNAVLLLTGTILASFFGTTGASMVMIRPILRSIAHRKHRVHTVVFFIFLVSNIGGCLTPIGDPPVFLGFLRGVDFFWPLINTIFPFLFTGGVVLITYFCTDVYLWRRERRQMMAESGDMEGGEIEHMAKKDEKTMSAGVGTSSIANAATVNGEVVDKGQLAKGSPSEAKKPVLPTSPPPTSEADSLGNGVTMNSVPTTLTEWPTLVSNDSSDGPLLHNSPAGANGGAGDAHDQNNLTHRIVHALEEEVHDIAHVLEEELVVIEEEVKQIEALRVAGLFNFALLLVIIAAVVASGYIKKAFPDAYFTVWVNPNDGEIIQWYYCDFSRDLILVAVTLSAWRFTPKVRFAENNFTWNPIREVAVAGTTLAIVFLGIFLTLIPILIIFELGEAGSLGWLV
ncbi:hypothetical protein HDU93_001901, partial [Gonapodya sp. JEL0774]